MQLSQYFTVLWYFMISNNKVVDEHKVLNGEESFFVP